AGELLAHLERDLAEHVALGIVEPELLALAFGFERQIEQPERAHEDRASNAADVPLMVSVTGPVRGSMLSSAPSYSLTSPRAKIEATKFRTSVAQISQYP